MSIEVRRSAEAMTSGEAYPKMCKDIENSPEFKALGGFILWHELKSARVGSSTIPGVTDPGDIDILVLERDGMVFEWAEKNGYEHGGSSPDDSKFDSFKKYVDLETAVDYWQNFDVLNIIVAKDEKFYNTFLDSNTICKEANLIHKMDRIAVFEYMRDPMSGNTISEKDFVKLVKGESLFEKGYFDRAIPF